ncbi:MAG: NAD-dependent succinate-semialdehyde dehydrogenase [Candidatus Omnitrophica bacterium]|nr:NAD-dependent succinate-semialdehyde dehydrogenase [Candidatus Omnitrophota bacterium]
MESVNPATGRKIKSYQETSLPEADLMIQQAQKSFEGWKKLSFIERGQKMKKASAILLENKEKYARLMANEMGKPFSQGKAEIEKCAWACNFYAKEAKNYLASELVKTEARKSFICYEPLGIILAIMPWNFPFWQVFRCAAPTLMAGNAIILKHASNVCGCALAIEDVFKKAGFPKGLFRSALIPSKDVKRLIQHPYIQAVTLTGSTQAGQKVAAQAGEVVKKCVLELGGSDPYIILEDADLERSVESCVASRLNNAGQSCVAAKRFIVVESIFKRFTEKFVEKMDLHKMGKPLDKKVTLGPLARHDLRDQLHKQVVESIEKGAQLLLGGLIPDDPGAFYPPTVLINVKPGMPAYHEELFGPVASVIKAVDEEEAIHIANDTPFGLGSGVFTQNLKRGERIAVQEIRAGSCFVNDYVKSDPRLPFGGIKQSGYGRELSGFGIREFVNIKTICIND